MRLKNKVAVITGAAHGMGAVEAKLFAKEGAKVVLADVDNKEGEKIRDDIVKYAGDAIFTSLNVTSEKDWGLVIDKTILAYGRLDILVNNAGISSGAYETPLDYEGWLHIMNVNSSGVFLGTKYAVPEMKKQGGGSIVNISSIMGIVGSDSGHPAYHASKGAVRTFTKATAVRYGPYGIRANSVHPGFMPPMGTSERSKSKDEELIIQTPLRRLGESIEAAHGVLFLASDESSFITGTELIIDGGFTAR